MFRVQDFRVEGLWLRVYLADPHRGLRFIDSCITQLKAQGPPRTCNESEKKKKKKKCTSHIHIMVEKISQKTAAVKPVTPSGTA